METSTSLHFTVRAVAKSKQLLSTSGKGEEFGVRIGAKGGGCSGFNYFMDFENTVRPDDHIMEFDGLKVFLDAKSAQYLAGTEVDYEDTFGGSGFAFKNPNAVHTCGCGSSFSV
ncbi:MAG: iron-sulfur cluster assembly accessory protein [Armatimonadetes bacterium]|nr:iron-sulfur cluster assembly accessory protein [Armatimonadota bacterium]